MKYFIFRKNHCRLISIVLCAALVAIIPTPQQEQAHAASGTYGKNDVMVLAKMIHGEARGESYVGKVAVGAVILNRVNFLTAYTAYASSLALSTLWRTVNII